MTKLNKVNEENKYVGAIINRPKHKKQQFQYCRGLLLKGDPKAITLISLIITIVVLIILAGVALSLSLGENGILTKAKLAKQETANAQDEENTILEGYANLIANYGGNGGTSEVLSADEVSFTPTDTNWNVNNIKDALDYLYSH